MTHPRLLAFLRPAPVLFCLAACIMTGCAGRGPTAPDEVDTRRNGAGTMTARIDGVAWSAGSVARATFDSPGSSRGLLRVEGAGSGMAVAFTVAATAPGSYPVRTGSFIDPDHSYGVNTSFNGDASGGGVTITSLTATRVTGTFQLTAVLASTGARRAIANGYFDVPIR